MTTSTKRVAWALASVAAGLGALGLSGAPPAASADTRADCPGVITCPLTGERVCRDLCPLGADAAVANTDSTAAPRPACCARG